MRFNHVDLKFWPLIITCDLINFNIKCTLQPSNRVRHWKKHLMNFEANSEPGIEIIYSLGQTKFVTIKQLSFRLWTEDSLCHWSEKQYECLFFTEVEKSNFWRIATSSFPLVTFLGKPYVVPTRWQPLYSKKSSNSFCYHCAHGPGFFEKWL